MNTTVIDEFASAPTQATMDRLIAAFRQMDVADEDISYLAVRLSESGEQFRHQGGEWIADVPSTGGPSSLSTLLCPLQLVMGGAIVPKLGVPGRPAGGIDVLACIQGFKTSLTRSEIDHCLASCRYAHFLAGESFAPLDAVLFEYRRKVGATDLPALAIASLLAKKRALGVTRVVLDVRVAPFTNFGRTWDDARQNAIRFIRVANMLHIHASCFLTDATAPYQGFLGRGESLVALHRIFSGDLTEDLTEHLGLCDSMASACFVNRHAVGMTGLKGVFTDHLEQQGGSWEGFARKVSEVESATSGIITAESDGYVCVDLPRVRELLVVRQEEAKSANNQFPDPCGLTLSVPWGTAVKKGDVVAKVRSSGNLAHLLDLLRLHIFQSVDPPVRRATETVASNG